MYAIQVIGQEKRALAGFSNVATMPHTGVLHYCDLVQSCPPQLRRKGIYSVFCIFVNNNEVLPISVFL